jgi:hypothetical protein
MPNKSTQRKMLAGTIRHIDIKVYFTHQGARHRWALHREVKLPLLQRREGGRWVTLEPVSIGRVIGPTEEAARRANRRGDRLVALFLFHAAIEGLLRANTKITSKEMRDFPGLIAAYLRRLKRKKVEAAKRVAVVQRLRAFNRLRNRVVHDWLWREGPVAVNTRLSPTLFKGWLGMYEEVLYEIGGELRM